MNTQRLVGPLEFQIIHFHEPTSTGLRSFRSSTFMNHGARVWQTDEFNGKSLNSDLLQKKLAKISEKQENIPTYHIRKK